MITASARNSINPINTQRESGFSKVPWELRLTAVNGADIPGMRWRRAARGCCASKGAKITVRNGHPWSSPGKEAIPNGYLYSRRSASLLNPTRRRKKKPLNLKIRYKWGMSELFQEQSGSSLHSSISDGTNSGSGCLGGVRSDP